MPATSSTSSRLPTLPARTSQGAIELKKRYPEGAAQVLTLFNPQMQVQYCRDVDRVHFGLAPKIGHLAEAFGANSAETWLEVQLADLSEFAGCKEKLSINQIREMAQMIIQHYPYYNLAEFMLFFQRFKQCRYGRFYGSVDPMLILQALGDFNRERARAFDARRQQQQEQRRALEQRGLSELQQRYKERVPGAFTEQAPLTFLQYRLMGYDSMPAEQLEHELAELATGRKTLPTDLTDILEAACHAG
ncbi:MAG: hypothetical protein J6L73_08695 [Muribaculaceae bacterium]|nr:hypothetical protein [Muribaculaceae bacterium]